MHRKIFPLHTHHHHHRTPLIFFPFLPHFPKIPSSNRNSMEEVWKEIKLTTLGDYSNNSLSPITPTQSHTSFRSLFLHEFLVPPCRRGTSKSSVSESILVASLEQPLPHPTPTLPTFTSASDWNKHASHSFLSSSTSSLEALSSSTLCKKKAKEEISSLDDRRHKRRIKNRESAARSRARKQAYTNELELELARLREENARLRRQQEKVCLTYPAGHHKKSNSI